MNVIVYTSPTCSYCRMLKEFLSQRGIAFEERDVSANPAAAQELMRSTGQMGVPVTIIDGQTVVGFDQPRLEYILSQRQEGQRLSFGAMIADAGKITARQGSGITLGAYIGKVRLASPAERAGLLAGDIITEINMRRIANAEDLEHAISSLSR
ncbi:MAG: glutaredoxin domain-containing protein, partial [Dehalococcoidales bacterium]|nr:glutaredoxin domain-containing protein [Dehalococcoidales bacterium]